MVLSSNQRLSREEGDPLHCVQVFEVGASLISLTNHDVHRDLNASHWVDELIRVGWHRCTIFHIFAENTHSGVLLHVLEVLQTSASQKRVLEGGLEVVQTDKSIHSPAIAEVSDVALASWSKQIRDVEAIQSLVKGANRCKISHGQPEIFNVDGQTGSQIDDFADLGAHLVGLGGGGDEGGVGASAVGHNRHLLALILLIPHGNDRVNHSCDILLANVLERKIPVLKLLIRNCPIDCSMVQSVLTTSCAANPNIVASLSELYGQARCGLIRASEEVHRVGEHAVEEEEGALGRHQRCSSWVSCDSEHHDLVA